MKEILCGLLGAGITFIFGLYFLMPQPMPKTILNIAEKSYITGCIQSLKDFVEINDEVIPGYVENQMISGCKYRASQFKKEMAQAIGEAP